MRRRFSNRRVRDFVLPRKIRRLRKCLLAVYLQSAVRWLSGRRRRFAKVARDYRMGLKSMISGPFLLAAWLALAAE